MRNARKRRAKRIVRKERRSFRQFTGHEWQGARGFAAMKLDAWTRWGMRVYRHEMSIVVTDYA